MTMPRRRWILMEQHQIKRIVAVDKDEHVVGMISEADVALRIPDEKKIEELVRSVLQPVFRLPS